MKPHLIVFAPTVELGVANLDPESTELLTAALVTAPSLVADALYVTSACDGEHGQTSFHYAFRAWDLRFLGTAPNLPDRTGAIDAADQRAEASRWAGRIMKLRPHWQVIVESDHIHAERDMRAVFGG